MPISIHLLGTVSSEDRANICSAAKLLLPENRFAISEGEISGIVPDAYISFLSDTPEILLEQFSVLPVGTGERFPFFQASASGNAGSLQKIPVTGYFLQPLTQTNAFTILRTIAVHYRFAKQNIESKSISL
jgi:hypothetical protein